MNYVHTLSINTEGEAPTILWSDGSVAEVVDQIRWNKKTVEEKSESAISFSVKFEINTIEDLFNAKNILNIIGEKIK